MRVHWQQHSFQTVYKKIKNQSNNPCACQDRTKRTHQNFAMYIFVCCYRAGLLILLFFLGQKTLTYDSFTTWQQTFENKTKQKTHWKMTKAVVNLMTTVKQNLQTYLHWSLTKIETYLNSIIFKPSMPNAVIETSRIKKEEVFFLSRQCRMNGWRWAALSAHQWRYNHKDWLPVTLNCPHLAEDWDDNGIFCEIQKDP